MISHRYKCIFVEVPKTGSTSIRAVIGSSPKPHMDIWQIKHELETGYTRYKGLRDKILGALYPFFLSRKMRKKIGERQFNTYFKFGFVRNPWDRTVALYNRKEGLQMSGGMTFEEFVEWISLSSDTCIHPTPHKNQLDWFTDPDGNILADFIGRFENLQKDWAFVCSKLGINAVLPRENINPGKPAHYTKYYTDKTRNIIAEKFQTDIETFGYEFSG